MNAELKQGERLRRDSMFFEQRITNLSRNALADSLARDAAAKSLFARLLLTSTAWVGPFTIEATNRLLLQRAAEGKLIVDKRLLNGNARFDNENLSVGQGLLVDIQNNEIDISCSKLLTTDF